MGAGRIFSVGVVLSLMAGVVSAQSGKVCAVQQYEAKGDGVTRKCRAGG